MGVLRERVGALRAEAAPSALRPGELAAHDITPLLDATAAPGPDARAPRKVPPSWLGLGLGSGLGLGLELGLELELGF